MSPPGKGDAPPAGEAGERRGAISALLEDLARTPELDPGAWRDALRPGERVGRFELLRELGRGGFGVVFEARDTELDRRVAFKAIRPGPRPGPAREELLRHEARAEARLQHPNIVTLFDSGLGRAGPYLIFEYLDGESLAARLRRGPLPTREALEVALAVARALAHAHGHGVLHRDLKPGNVFLPAAGEAKVLDFGLAHFFGSAGPQGSGTPGYMAPEQRRGAEEDERTDVFGLGLLLHEMLSGQPLLRADGSRDPEAALPAGRGAAGAFSRLAAAAAAEDPAARPGSAQEVLDRLLELRSQLDRARAGRRWRLVAAAAGLIAVAAVVTFRFIPAPPALAVVADVVNETGDPDLDGLSGLLITGLEPSPRIRPVPRGRMLDLLARMGKGAPGRIDEGLAREVARKVAAGVLLVTRVGRYQGGYAAELQAIALPGDRVLFSVPEEAPDKDHLPDLVDRLAERTRRAFQERAPGAEPGPTESLEAYSQYFRAEECAARPAHGQDCGQGYRRAVALDPTFAAAHYALAVWNHTFGGTRQEEDAAMAAALQHLDRAPEKERLLIRAWAAHGDGRDDEALALYARAAERWPQDKQAFYMAGDLLLHRDEPRAAIPWYEKVLELDPEHGWSVVHVADWLLPLGRRANLEAWARRWEESGSPAALHGLSRARGWLGDVAGAAEAARRSLLAGGGMEAAEDLGFAQVIAGDYVAAEAQARGVSGSAVSRRLGYYGVAALEAYQGRPRAGWAALEDMVRRFPDLDDSNSRTIRADYLLGGGEPAALRAEVEVLGRMEPRLAAEHAAGLAWLGDARGAAELARGLVPGSLAARTYEAVRLWASGDRERGLGQMREVAGRDPLLLWRVAPLWLQAEMAAQLGRDAEAVEALRRFQALYIPRMMWRSWAQSRSQLLLARALERLGEQQRALEAVDRLLLQWREAEPDLPPLAEARALRARLSSGPGRSPR